MTTRTALRREDVRDILGDVDDFLAAEILSTGASQEELVEAVEDLECEVDLGEERPEPSTPTVAKLREILNGVLGRDRWPEEEDRR